MNGKESLQENAVAFPVEKGKPARKRKKKEGRGFFIGLLTLSGIIIFLLGLVVFQGKEIMIFTFEKFVINKAFVSLLPADYSLEKAEGVRKEVYDFFEAAAVDRVDDPALIAVSSRLREIIQDERVLDEEVVSLMALIREKRASQ